MKQCYIEVSDVLEEHMKAKKEELAKLKGIIELQAKLFMEKRIKMETESHLLLPGVCLHEKESLTIIVDVLNPTEEEMFIRI